MEGRQNNNNLILFFGYPDLVYNLIYAYKVSTPVAEVSGGLSVVSADWLRQPWPGSVQAEGLVHCRGTVSRLGTPGILSALRSSCVWVIVVVVVSSENPKINEAIFINLKKSFAITGFPLSKQDFMADKCLLCFIWLISTATVHRTTHLHL